MVEGIYPNFDRSAYLEGELQPVFFGSALNNFGVKELLDCFIDIAPTPRPMFSEERLVKPNEDKFSGFIFKIHANMDPKHRDRLAFVKIVSGTFKRNTTYLHVRHKKKLKFSSPNAFFAEKTIKIASDINGTKSLSTFAKFIKEISINVPVLYGIFSIGLALVLGVGAAIVRKIISQAIDKYKENNKA